MAATARLRLDPFLMAIIAAAVLASIVPAVGIGVEVLSWATRIAIFVLFFLYGSRLKPQEALAGLKHWRLHLVILAFTFVLFPLIGLGVSLLPGWIISPLLVPGIIYLTLCPSTVQSSVNFTSIAGGNVAGSIVAASISNLIGVVLTPVLAIALMNTTGTADVGWGSVLDIMGQILLPFVLGQLSRPWTAAFVARHKRLKLVDQGSIVLAVYSAFSAGMREGIWSEVDAGDIVSLCVISVVLLVVMLWLTWTTAKRLGFDRADCIAIQMCGTKKSLATGLPMAMVLFVGQPLGLMMLPLMVFHQAQLMAASWLATHYARTAPVAHA